jgi:hypothetical protein
MSINALSATAPVTAAAAKRAGSWAAQAWADRDVDDAGLAVDSLALASLCRLLCEDAADEADAVEAAVALTVRSPAWAAANLLTSFIAAAEALRAGNDFAESAAQYLRLLDELGPENVPAANGVLVRVALYGVDDIARIGAPVDGPPDARLLHGLPDDTQKLLLDIETSSAFGLAPMRDQPPISILLDGAALAAFRVYDLPRGMRLLRARRYLNDGDSPGVSTGFEFLRLAQCDDGSFGDFETPIARMAARGDRNERLQLKLPVTLQALWTMAELEDPAFRLIRSALPAGGLIPFYKGGRDADHHAT